MGFTDSSQSGDETRHAVVAIVRARFAPAGAVAAVRMSSGMTNGPSVWRIRAIELNHMNERTFKTRTKTPFFR
ncbi:hypothetical protein [Lysobacter gummosus]|uniref:hypothetical protein n=1 Tax=Lysobacter gummosus TaxID=262324 RepID=UPI003629262E